jgi:REP element-mobilizing transposase RayT
MRKLRLLKQGVWYGVRTRINNGEPLFCRRDALVLFARVFIEAEARFGFEVRGLCLEDDGVALFLKPADGLELPAIMKWVKQTFAARFNRRDGRTGHIWGDRYVSWVLEGEPPAVEEREEDSVNAVVTGTVPRGGRKTRVRPFGRKAAGKALFSPVSPRSTPSPPG